MTFSQNSADLVQYFPEHGRPDLKGIKQEMQQNEKALGTAPVMQEKGTDLAGNATKDTPKRN